MTKLLITGAGGQLGRSLASQLESRREVEAVFLSRRELDLTDLASIESSIADNRPDAVINAAAYTAVDQAETDQELADRVNHLAVEKLGDTCFRLGIPLIHVSTDYVFDGCHYRPYRETDSTAPVSVYGKSKLAGEQALLESGVRGAIVRTSWLYARDGRNFVNTMQRLGRERDSLAVVADQVGSPTNASDLAAAILHRLDNSLKFDGLRVYHYANAGVASWYDLAHAVFEITGIDCHVDPIPTEAYPTPAPRPHFSVLDTRRLRSEWGVSIPHWRDSLRRVLSTSG